MPKIYFIVLISAIVFGAYFYGKAKCQFDVAQDNLIRNQKQQELYLKSQRIIHENVYKTGVADIRRILRDKYTIAE